MSNTAPQPTRLEAAQIPATVCVAALTLATVISLCRVFPDWAYLNDMVLIALGTHAVAFLLRVARVHVLLALPVLLFTIVELIALIYYGDTLSGPFPTSRTFDVMRIDLRLVIEQFPTAVAPVPSVGNYAVAGAAAIAVCAALADTFAFRAMGRLEAIVPTGAIFIFTAALGTDNHRIGVAALWIAMALLTVAVLRFRHTSEEATWMGARRMTLAAALPAVLVTFGLTAVVAATVAPRLPGAGERALVDTRNRQGSVTEVLSPLVDIGAQMRNRGNLELFTVESSDGGHYWRTYASPLYDNGQWSPLAEDLQEMGDRSGEVLLPTLVSLQTIQILALGGHNVPATYRPVSVSPADVRWTEETEMLILPDVDLQSGDRISVVSMVPRPTVEQLLTATADNPPDGALDLPGGLPQLAKDEALAATAGAVTPYEKALALQNYFRNFDYDLYVQYGNSYDAIEAFLRGRSGFCQQFAGSFGVMARYLGLPTRMAVGFTPGDLRADGRFHVFGRHAHAWPEVWFDGIGWVAFEPTPGRGSPDATDYTNVLPAQFTGTSGGDGATQQTTPATVAERNPGDPESSTTVPGGARPGGAGGATSTTLPVGSAGGGSGGGSALQLLVAGLAAALLAWVVFAPRIIRALSQRHDNTPRDRVIGAWHRTVAALSFVGAPALGGETPLEYADIAERATGVDHRALREMAVHVTRAVYAPRDIDEQTAARCELLAGEVAAVCRDRTPTQLRVKALFDPRLMRRRFAN